MKIEYSTKELCEILNLAKSSLLERAKRENWKSSPRKGKGGGSVWLMLLLPPDVQAKIVSHNAAMKAREDYAFSTEGLAERYSKVQGFTEKSRDRMDVRVRILTIFRDWARNRMQRLPYLPEYSERTKARAFAELWNKQELGLSAEVYNLKRKLNGNSIVNWLEKVKTSSTAALVGNYGVNVTAFFSHKDVQECFFGIMYAFPASTYKQVFNMLEARFADVYDLPVYDTVKKYVKRWRGENKAFHTQLVNPDAFRGSYMVAVGSASEYINRFCQSWEMDSTKVDLMTSDGQRHNLTAVIDVYTRDAYIYVSRTSTAHAVASTLRKGLINWGKPEMVSTDNGADYVSAHMERVFLDLGITRHLCPPFSPWKKPFVERFFKTFLHDLLELMPGYVGHNVAERQAIRERESFAKRLMQGDSSNKAYELAMSPEELQEWIDQWLLRYRHTKHSGLNGKTPFEMVRDAHQRHSHAIIMDDRALDVLLLPLAEGGSGYRTISKKGLRAGLPGHYWAGELSPLVGQRVQVRIDDTDLSVAYVFDEDGRFITKALNSSMHGISREDAKTARRLQNAALTSLRKEGLAKAKAHEVANLPQEILMRDVAKARQQEEHLKAVDSDPVNTVYAPPALFEARRAVDSDMPQGYYDTMLEIAREKGREEQEQKEQPFLAPQNSYERYCLAKLSLEMHEDGHEVPVRQLRWAKSYSGCAEYLGHKMMDTPEYTPTAQKMGWGK